MAKRKKAKKSTHRRRRVGAVSGMGKMLVDTAAVIAGAAAGAFINQALTTAVPTMPKWTGGLVLVAGGLAVEHMAKKNEAIQNVGTGIVAAGGLFLLNETFISVPGISGVGFVTNYDRHLKPGTRMQSAVGAPGYMDKAIGSTQDLATIAGILDN